MDTHSVVSLGTSVPLLVTVNEVASTLRVSTRYVRSLIRREAIPVVRLGRRTLVRRVDLEEIVARGGLGEQPR